MAFDGWVVANLVTIVIFFITVGYYKGKVDTITKDNETLHSKMDAYHRRLDTHGDDLVRLNTNIKQIKRDLIHLSTLSNIKTK